MTIKEVYDKYYHQDLLDEFNYTESIEGYNQALAIVIGGENKTVEELVNILTRQKQVMMNWPDHHYNEIQRYRYSCGWDYVRMNLASAKRIVDENIENPIFLDGNGLLRAITAIKKSVNA